MIRSFVGKAWDLVAGVGHSGATRIAAAGQSGTQRPLDGVGGGPGGDTVWKDGQTGGYASVIAYSRRTGAGAVVLSNTSRSQATLGWQLTEPPVSAG